MRFAVAVMACVLAVASAQFNVQNKPHPFTRLPQYKNVPHDHPFPSYGRRPYAGVSIKPVVPVAPVPKLSAVVPVPKLPAVVPVPKLPAVVPVPVAKVAADARSAETIKSAYDLNEDGSYNYFFETNNGIAAQAQGTPRNFGGNPPLIPDVAQGSFSWISPEGKSIYVTYVADENGYQPQSDALPVPPEVPEQIARALAYTAKYHKN